MVFSLCRCVVIGTITNALDARRPPPSKEPPSGVRWFLVPASSQFHTQRWAGLPLYSPKLIEVGEFSEARM